MTVDIPHKATGRWKELLFLLGLAAVLLAITLARTGRLTYGSPGFSLPKDHHKYIWMAERGPFDFHIAPFCWRVLNPLLARVLPFGLQTSFLVLAFAATCLTAVSVFYLARAFGFGRDLALFGMLLFLSLGYATEFVLYDFWLCDPLAFLFTALTISCIAARRDGWFALLLALGVMAKETVLFVAPLYYTLNAGRVLDLACARPTVLYLLPACAVLVALRVFIPASNDDPAYTQQVPENVLFGSYGFLGELERVGLERLRTFGKDTIASLTTITWGALAGLLPLFALRRNLPLLLRFSPFLLLVYAQILFATNTERLLVLGFPAMILMALNGVDAIARRLDVDVRRFLLLPVLMWLLNLFDPREVSTPFEVQSLVVLLYLAGVSQMGRASRPGASPPGPLSMPTTARGAS